LDCAGKSNAPALFTGGFQANPPMSKFMLHMQHKLGQRWRRGL